jgi:Glycosyl hydrolase family 65 central catalytic domain/Glycosyl hydrolase family 65, C-terminal domain
MPAARRNAPGVTEPALLERGETAVATAPPLLDRRFDAIVFDWDGTAVPNRQADASRVREVVEALCANGMHLAVITGTHVGNVDGQLGARPPGPGRLYLCMNRGSEVFTADEDGVSLVSRREASPEEDRALDRAAALTVEALAKRGIEATIVSQRLNRRKIDLIPLPEWADPPKARIAELFAAVQARLNAGGVRGLDEAVELARAAAFAAGLPDPRVTSDAKHVEIGLTDKSDSARWMLAELGRLGIAPGLVLVAGDEFGPLGGLAGSDSFLLVPEGLRATAVSVGAEPTGVPDDVIGLGGGPEAFVSLLEDQLARRLAGDPPELDGDPLWTLEYDDADPLMERVRDSLFAIADGRLGTSDGIVLAAGLYDGDGPDTTLLPCPLWQRLVPADGAVERRRRLDLRTGVLERRIESHEGVVRAALFSSLARPGTAALRAESDGGRVAPGSALVPPGAPTLELGTDGAPIWIRERASTGGVVAAARETEPSDGRLERLAAYHVDPLASPSERSVLQALDELERSGYEQLLGEHRAAWADRWAGADVAVEGDPELQLAVRLGLFHLMASAAADGEAAVGARGLSGGAYRGHVFWDSDVFVLPFLAATHPPAARAMLEYRLGRLDDSRAAARRLGRRGARFAWESARDGFDVTPSHARDQTGRLVAIRTGELEEHIVADVAWAACCYADWSGDDAFLEGEGRDLLIETARYWASRIRFEGQGRAHIYGVIGPDEYHEPVDDNAFTNVMARWNLRRAAELPDVEADERALWRRAADALVDGYDPATRIYEQFAGFSELEPIVIAEIAPRRPIAADLLLGAERVEGAQVLKQADVLMLHHLVPDEVEPGSLVPNLDFYEPRCAHGSSLSPAIHASLLARAGRPDQALEPLRLAARIDLDDLTGTTAGGVHLATMGGVWQALAYGFAGLRSDGAVLRVDPSLPQAWDALVVRLRYRGSVVEVRLEHERILVEAEEQLPVAIGASAPAYGTRLEYRPDDAGWRVMQS